MKPVVGKLLALQSFFLSRPRLDIALLPNPGSSHGQRAAGPSPRSMQIQSDSIPISELKYDLEFYWNYKIRIKNNSSKTAYGIKIEELYKSHCDYLSKLDDLASLKEGEMLELEYILRVKKSMNGREAENYRKSFPSHLEKIEIILSYTNEGRTRFYTKFIAASELLHINEHLFRKPKELE